MTRAAKTATADRDVDYGRLRHEIPTLGQVDRRLWKLVGGDDFGSRTAALMDGEMVILESAYRAPSEAQDHRELRPGWNAFVYLGGKPILKANFPHARYSEDDVPARAELHALAMFCWQARQGTHPRWKTVGGALRYLKPGLEQETALVELDERISMLVEAWQLLADDPRGPVDPDESSDIRTIRASHS